MLFLVCDGESLLLLLLCALPSKTGGGLKRIHLNQF